MSTYKSYKIGEIITLKSELPFPKGTPSCYIPRRNLDLMQGKTAEIHNPDYVQSGYENGSLVKIKIGGIIPENMEGINSLFIPKTWIENGVLSMSEEFL